MFSGRCPNGPDLAMKRAFLETGAAWSAVGCTEVIETHYALVFLTPDTVWKMKKPVNLPHLDYRNLAAREAACRTEVRLNRALAGDVYRGVRSLTIAPGGGFEIDGTGEVVEWFVEMRRLPQEQLLDHRLCAGPAIGPEEIEHVADRMLAFYRTAPRPAGAGLGYLQRWQRDGRLNSEHLEEMRTHLGAAFDPSLAPAALHLIEACGDEILSRGAQGWIVEGHGDLRPEHICLENPPVIFDRMDFDPLLLPSDPYDEFNLLGLDCAAMGANWIRGVLMKRLADAGVPPASPRLIAAYGANRYLARARLSIDHLRDPVTSFPWKWPLQAGDYLARARYLLDREWMTPASGSGNVFDADV